MELHPHLSLLATQPRQQPSIKSATISSNGTQDQRAVSSIRSDGCRVAGPAATVFGIKERSRALHVEYNEGRMAPA